MLEDRQERLDHKRQCMGFDHHPFSAACFFVRLSTPLASNSTPYQACTWSCCIHTGNFSAAWELLTVCQKLTAAAAVTRSSDHPVPPSLPSTPIWQHIAHPDNTWQRGGKVTGKGSMAGWMTSCAQKAQNGYATSFKSSYSPRPNRLSQRFTLTYPYSPYKQPPSQTKTHPPPKLTHRAEGLGAVSNCSTQLPSCSLLAHPPSPPARPTTFPSTLARRPLPLPSLLFLLGLPPSATGHVPYPPPPLSGP